MLPLKKGKSKELKGGRKMRENKNEHIVDYSNTIKKSNDVSMAKLNQNLTLNQIQLLAYAIFSTQQNGETYFRKYEFQKNLVYEIIKPKKLMRIAIKCLL